MDFKTYENGKEVSWVPKDTLDRVFKIDPAHEFRYELSCIKSEFYMNLVMQALAKIPDYFWFVPASASGKYHPKSSLGTGGLVRHVKAVFRLSEELLTHPLYAPFTDAEKDEIRIGILLHDACKQGFDNTPSHTLTEHPLLPRIHLKPGSLTPEGEEAWSRICDYIETHMGIWTKDKEGNEVLQIPQTKIQLFVHMCDYIASRAIVEVDTTDREAQLGYGQKNDKPDWKQEIATEGQIGYIKRLAVMCAEKQVAHPYGSLKVYEGTTVVMKKGEAHEIIENFKKLLGLNK